MESSSNHYYNSNVIAPFIMKTYQMVNDPSTDFLITWGKANNSFIVVEPSEFSQRILPVFFKHNNFSSFVRQLNTYGFKKVDPDRCEFAHEHFLRGQEHLLSNIARRKYNSTRSSISCMKNEDIDDEEIMMEIRRLKEEQNALERELQGMNKRLEVTEKRPQQMMSFLCKVVEDPDSLNRMMHDKHSNMQLQIGEVIKKRRLMISSAASSSSCSSYGLAASSSVKTEEDEDEVFVEIERFRCSPIETYHQSWWDDRMTQQTYGSSGGDHTPFGTVPGSGMVVAPPGTGSISGGGGEIGSVQVSYGGTQIGASPRPAYPFSLLEGGF